MDRKQDREQGQRSAGASRRLAGREQDTEDRRRLLGRGAPRGGDEDRRLLLVPLRVSRIGALAIRTGRLASGARVGLAFTSIARLRGTMGPAQRWVTLNAATLRRMLADADIDGLRIDPLPTRPARREAAIRRGRVPATR
jgi:hypothetical protein